jgi:transporter family-2 protein
VNPNGLYLLLTITAGAGLAFQAVINTRLGGALGAPLWAAVTQVFIGFVSLLIVAGVLRQPMPDFSAPSHLPWWIWIGGMLGSLYVFTAIVSTRPLGVVLMVAAAIVGQTIAALLIDHYGWFGVDVHRITPQRVVGIALLLAGVLLIRRR